MNATVILEIPEPCDESWSKMEPTAHGRYCRSCERELIDFSKWSDSRIIRYIEANDGKICGRFAPRQLDRTLDPDTQNPRPYSGLTLHALVLLAVSLTYGGALLAAPIDSGMSYSLFEGQSGPQKGALRRQKIHSGTVIDKTGEALPFVLVTAWANGVQIASTYTDLDGHFQLTFEVWLTDVTVYFSYMDFAVLSVTIGESDAEKKATYEMEQYEEMSLGIVVQKQSTRKQRRTARKAERRSRRNEQTD